MFWLSRGRLIGGVEHDTTANFLDIASSRAGIQLGEDRRNYGSAFEHGQKLVQTALNVDRRCMPSMRVLDSSATAHEKETILLGSVQVCLVVAAPGSA